MEAFILCVKGCLLDYLDWVPNRGTCIRVHQILVISSNLNGSDMKVVCGG